MTQRLTLVTLGVADLERAAAFYTAVGFERVAAPESIIMLRTVGSVIALLGWDELAEDAGVPGAAEGGFRGITLASNQDSRDEIDTAYELWLSHGA